jgi:hypothetical protein
VSTPAAKCHQCPALAEDGDLCGPCAVELAHQIMDGEPNREFAYCEICSTPYRWTEARVLRRVKNPTAHLGGAQSSHTPYLCWVCARLHLSTLIEQHTPPAMF